MAMKKNRRAKKTSTKAQEMRNEALRKGLKAPRTDVPTLHKFSAQGIKRAKERNFKVMPPGDKKGYLQERDKCPALAQIREAANKAQRGVEMTNVFASSSSRASGSEGPGL